MFHVNKGRHVAHPLGFGDDVLAEGRLAGRLGAKDLGDATARDVAAAEGQGAGATDSRLAKFDFSDDSGYTRGPTARWGLDRSRHSAYNKVKPT